MGKKGAKNDKYAAMRANFLLNEPKPVIVRLREIEPPEESARFDDYQALLTAAQKGWSNPSPTPEI